uniref:CP n=1 Tax=Daiswa trichovirus 1 TaxID=2794435 RepID=A0A7T5QZ67_9VIRU|nr:CP [Daiswa trichovirus 1]
MSSIKSTIASNIKNAVFESITLSVVRATVVPADVQQAILDHIAGDIFGNIALYQASESAIFPNVTRIIPSISIGQPVVDYQFEYNLRVMVDTFKALIQTSANVAIRGITFRQLCVPFAEEARTFLRNHYLANGGVSALAETMPSMCESAPWVAFDFNKGLNFRTLSSGERRVIQNLNRRLFSSQSRLAVVGAQIDAQNNDLAA